MWQMSRPPWGVRVCVYTYIINSHGRLVRLVVCLSETRILVWLICSYNPPIIHVNSTVDEVAYFFRDFRVRPEGIRPVADGAQQEQQQECVVILFA